MRSHHKDLSKREVGGPVNRAAMMGAEGREGALKKLQLALKMDLGATSEGMQAASRSWQRQGMDSPPEPPQGSSPGTTLMLGLWTSRMVR